MQESTVFCGPSSGLGYLTSLLNYKTTPKINQWMRLNPDLMDKIYHLYTTTGILRTVISRISSEALRGGVHLREVDKKEPQRRFKDKKKKGAADIELSPAEVAHIEEMLDRAILFAHLYGMVPIVNTEIAYGGACDTDDMRSAEAQASIDVPASSASRGGNSGEWRSNGAETSALPCVGSLSVLDIPLPTSGFFISKSDRFGRVEVAWQWRSANTSVHPAKGVWVFVWKNQFPYHGCSSPFNSVIISAFNEIMRVQELIEMDTQASYELSHPPLLTQDHARSGREVADRSVYEFATRQFVADPDGDDMMGIGPGGTMIGDGSINESRDQEREVRTERSIRSAIRSRRRMVQSRINPATGRFYTKDHTLLYERGNYPVPTGLNVVSSYPRPVLRGDLGQVVEYVYRNIAITFGVPPVFINSGSTNVQGGAGNRRSSSSSSSGDTDAAVENMRNTVMHVRNELAAMFAQAHYYLVWNTERINLAHHLAREEIECLEKTKECDQLMERQLELLGTELAEAVRERQIAEIRDRGDLMRAAQIVDQAGKLFRDERVSNHITSILGIVAGVTDGSLGFPGDMTLEGVAERERRGEGFSPEDEGVLRHPDDIQGDLTRSPKKGRKKPSVDPNELAEYPEDKRDRIEKEGLNTSGYTTVPFGSMEHQRTNLSRPVSVQEALAKAEEIVDRRLAILEESKRLDGVRGKFAPASGRRGDTKIELIFNSLPLPQWDTLRKMVLDHVLDPERYKEMLLTNMGLDPEMDGPPAHVKPLSSELEAAKPKENTKSKPENAGSGNGGGRTKRPRADQKESELADRDLSSKELTRKEEKDRSNSTKRAKS
jgi:hypothetical protein